MAKRRSANGDPQPYPFNVTRGGKTVRRWRIIVTVGTKIDGSLDRRSRTFDRQADAIAWKREILNRKASGSIGPIRLSTVAEYLDRWLEMVVRPNRSASTAESYGYAIRHVKPYLGAKRLDRLSTGDVESWLADLLRNGAGVAKCRTTGDAKTTGARTRQNAFRVLSAALDYAVKRGDLGLNPCKRVESPTADREEIDPFTRAEVDAILSATSDDRFSALYRLLFTTGMRQGEAFGLSPKNVDLDACSVRVVRQVVETDGRIVFSKPKSAASVRTIPIPESTAESIRDHLERMRAERRGGLDLLFVGREGGTIRRSTFAAREWNPTLDQLGIRRRGAHHIRHSFASFMLGAGVSLPVVSKILGHARPSITADIYSHAMKDQLESSRAASRSLFG